MNESLNHQPVDPELEARVVALVLGEASDLERGQLSELIAQRPELATVQAKYEAINGLLHHVGSGEEVKVDDDWKLPAEKRNRVLSVVSGESPSPVGNDFVSKTRSLSGSASFWGSWSIARIAASVCVLGGLGVLLFAMLVPQMNAARSSVASVGDRGSVFFEELSAVTEEQAWEAEVEIRSDANSARMAGQYYGRGLDASGGVAKAEVDYESGPESALSGIRDSLETGIAPPSPYYLQDDVQYFPSSPSVDESAIRLQRKQEGQDIAEGFDFHAPNPLTANAPRRFRAIENDGFAELGKKLPDVQQRLPGSSDEQAGRRFSDSRVTQEFAEVGQPKADDVFSGGTSLNYQRKLGRSRMGGNGSGAMAGGAGLNFDADSDQRMLMVTPRILIQEEEPESVGLAVPPVPPTADFAMDFEAQMPMEANLENRGGSLSSELIDEPLGIKPLGIKLKSARGLAGAEREMALLSKDPRGKSSAPKSALEIPIVGDFAVAPRKGVEEEEVAQSEFDPSRRGSEVLKRKSKIRSVEPQPADRSDVKKITPSRKPASPERMVEIDAAKNAFSTFSLHVSDVSFKLALAALSRGEWPEPTKVRIEEFVNAFDYGDPMPGSNEPVSCYVEQSSHPFAQQRNLLRVSMRTAAAGRASSTPLRLTLLLDNSGSMERFDRQQTVRRAFTLLAKQLKPMDQVTLLSFAGRPRLLADKVNGSEASELVKIIADLPSEGGTNIEAALQLAFEKAEEQRVDDAQNRVILLTDGAVNLGDADPESLSRMIAKMRDAGIAFDAAGINAEGLNDEVLEALTRQGDGRYYLLDTLDDADDGFARQIAGALRPSAKNVKVQVEFNPKRVGRYKLLGFEKHRLKKDDFRNDKVDAAEMAAAEAGVAIYQVEAKPDGEGDVGSVSVRFRDLSSGQMVENRWPIPYDADAPRPDRAAPSLRLATSAAMLAAKLRGDPLGESVDLKSLSDLIAGLPEDVRQTKRVQQLQQMIQQARQVSGQ